MFFDLFVYLLYYFISIFVQFIIIFISGSRYYVKSCPRQPLPSCFAVYASLHTYIYNNNIIYMYTLLLLVVKAFQQGAHVPFCAHGQKSSDGQRPTAN